MSKKPRRDQKFVGNRPIINLDWSTIIEGDLYQVTYVEPSLDIERTMIARFDGIQRFGDSWSPVWILDPPDQLHGVGLAGPILSVVPVDAGGSEP